MGTLTPWWVQSWVLRESGGGEGVCGSTDLELGRDSLAGDGSQLWCQEWLPIHPQDVLRTGQHHVHWDSRRDGERGC